MDRFTAEVLKYIRKEELIAPGDRIVIGLSGGADSSALALVLSRLKALLKAELIALHVQHGLRGSEAYRDEQAAGRLAESLGLSFYSVAVDVRQHASLYGMSEEEAARELRYRALRAKGREIFGESFLIAVAHHSSDQAETILFNMLRGSGLAGLGGMRPKRDDIIRPFLALEKADILDFLGREGIDYVVDSTNLTLDHTRNRLRHVIIPELYAVNAKAAAHITALGDKLYAIDEYLRTEARAYIAENCGTGEGYIRLNSRKLKEKDRVLRIYVIIEGLKRIGVPLKDWGERQFSDIDALIFLGRDKSIDLPGGVKADNQSGDTTIKANKQGDETHGL